MQNDTNSHTLPANRSRWSRYTLVWGVLALGSAGYLGWLSSQSHILARNAPDALPAGGEGNQGQRAMGDALAEVQSLKNSIEEVRSEVSSLRTDLAQVHERSTAIVGRVAALEERPAGGTKSTAAIAPAPSAPAVATAATAPAQPAPAAQTAKAPETKAAPAAPKVINAPKAAEAAKDLVTGSVAANAPQLAAAATAAATAAGAPVVFGPAVVKPAAKPIGVQIATGPSLDSIRLSWSLLSDRHASELKPLQPRYVAGQGPDGTTYDLVAGPIKSAAEAKKICESLEAGLVKCTISSFDGDAL